MGQRPKINFRKSLGIIVLAALSVLLILGAQYFYTHKILKTELEYHARLELTLKAILIKSMLNNAEISVRENELDVRRTLNQPDSIYEIARWLLQNNPHLVGAGMAFMPDYYSDKGRLFEPYCLKVGNEIEARQISGPNHDYTKLDFFTDAIGTNDDNWSDPYVDTIGKRQFISTFAHPVHDNDNKLVGVFGIDMSLSWLSDTINSHHLHPSSFAMLLTESGQPIVSPSDKHRRHCDAGQVARLVKEDKVQDKYDESVCRIIYFESDADGSNGTIFHAFLKGNPHWQLAVVCYDNEVYGKLNWMMLNIVILLLIASAMLTYIIRNFAINENKLHRVNLEQERISSELRIASSIQKAMLPHLAQPLSRHNDVDVSGVLLPAKEVGGDFYDYFVRDEKLYFCIGDVSGKGVPSALVMAVAQALFHAATERESNPGNIMQTINKSLYRNNDRNMFVTMFAGVLDIPTGRLRFSNAGHDKPVLIGENAEMLAADPNLPVGVFDDVKYSIQEITLQPGSVLFLYTDGVTEAMNVRHEQFGQQRMLDTLNRYRQQLQNTAEGLVEAITGDVHRFVQDAEQSDDLTLLVIRYEPKPFKDILGRKLVLPNDVAQIPRLGSFVEEISQQLQLDTTLQHQIRLAVEEAVVNVMMYAYPAETEGEVSVEAHSNGECIKFIITDSGVHFDPTEAAKADTSLSAEDRPIGGLGIFLVRELMDSINYERFEGKNILTLRKYYNSKNQNNQQ